MSAPPLGRTFPDVVREFAVRMPDALAVAAGGTTTTFAELDAAGARTAAGFAGLGLRRGDAVGILCTNRHEWLVALAAAGRIGARLTAFDTWSRGWDLEFLLEHSRVPVLLLLGSFRGRNYVDDLVGLVPELAEDGPGAWRSRRFPDLREVVVIGSGRLPAGARGFSELADSEPLTQLPPGECASPSDVAFVLYTSGSAARPKAVPLRHGNAIENAFNIGERMGLTAADRIWVSVPLFWSYGLANATLAAFTHGAAVVLQEAFEAGEALDLIEAHRCTAVYTLPNITTALLEHPAFSRERVAAVRTGLTIGSPEDVRRAAEDLGAREICNVYGSTETYGNCAVTASSLPLPLRLETQGRPLPGTTIRIVDVETGRDCAPGGIGEVWVSGYVADSYLDAPELTAESFTSDGFYRSGDLGTIDEEGFFRFVSRRSEMIKTGGVNVSPLEVEAFLVGHPAVRAAAVVGLPDDRLGQVVTAFVELVEDAAESADDLRAYCGARLAGYKTPGRIVVVPALPTTDTGKIDRRALRERLSVEAA